MARARLTDIKQDLINDEGAVLWSFVKGEQLEYPITLGFLVDSTRKPESHLNYRFEAVVVEAENIVGQTSKPTRVRVGGEQTRLVVRSPVFRGTWAPITTYAKEEIVLHSGKYYKLANGVDYVSATPPDIDPMWLDTARNIVYLQFNSTLGALWEVQPGVNHPSYGFFELRVTEPSDIVFTRTFKPVRGMVEILFSPTDIVPDV